MNSHDQFMTALFYTIAVIHCLSSRVIAPFLKALYEELTSPTNTNQPTPLTVVVADAPDPVKAPAKPVRRRRSTKAAA